MNIELYFSGDDKESLLALLDERDRELLALLHHGKASEQSAIAQALMKKAASALGYWDIHISRNEKGAPVANSPQLFVSASHTKNCCAAAAAHHPIGIDAQPVESCREKVMARLYSQKEQNFVLNHADKDYAFTLLWTLKEAYGKMKGVGLMAAKDVEFLPQDGLLCCSDESLQFSTKQYGSLLISIVEQPSD